MKSTEIMVISSTRNLCRANLFLKLDEQHYVYCLSRGFIFLLSISLINFAGSMKSISRTLSKLTFKGTTGNNLASL